MPRLLRRVAAALPFAMFALLLSPAAAQAYVVTVDVVGAGTIVEVTDAHLMNCTGAYGDGITSCSAGSASGDYGWGWVVRYRATARPGMEFSRWENPSGGPVACDGATGSTYSGADCQFATYDNLRLRAVFVDTTAPAAPALSGPASPTNSTTAYLSYSRADDPTVSGYQWKLDRPGLAGTWGWTQPDTHLTTDVTVNGSYTFSVRAVDWAGYLSQPASLSWTVDTVPPVVTMTVPEGDNHTNAATVLLSGQADGATVVTVFDNGAQVGQVAPWPNGWSFRAATGAEGSHVYTVRARDDAGNVSALSGPRTVIVDRTAPYAGISSPGEGSFDRDGNVSLAGSAEPGSTVEVREGTASRGTALATAEGGWTLVVGGLSNGSHTFTVTATDLAGNVSGPSAGRTVVVDTVRPGARIVSPSRDAVGVSRKAVVVARFTEAVRPSTVLRTTVTLVRKGTSTRVAATVRYDPATRKVVLDPSDRLRPRTTYVVSVTTGVLDLAGNRLARKVQWSFRTGR